MKPTIKVSIGGSAFSLEEDAYQVLSSYLDSLKKHFSTNTESEEIIGDIEQRLSELLQMRLSSSDRVVSLDDALETVKIMGSPKDFDEGEESSQQSKDSSTNSKHDASIDSDKGGFDKSYKKKLYRDTDNKIVGGVFSGLGHYFRIDPTALRLIFVGLLFLLNILASFPFFSFRGAGVLLLVYVILWVVMPVAKTFNQKLSMTGSDPSIHDIENRTKASTKKYRGSSAAGVIGIFVNIIVGFAILVTFLIFISTIIFFLWLYFDSEILGLNNYFILFGLSSISFKLAILIIILLPIIGVLNLLLKIFHRSVFTSTTLTFFIIGFIFWIGSILYLGNKGMKFAYKKQQEIEVIDTVDTKITSDILYVKLGNKYSRAEMQPNNPRMYYLGEKVSSRKVFLLPKVKVVEDTLVSDYKIQVSKQGFGQNMLAAKRKVKDAKFDYQIKDSVLTLNPSLYTKRNPWNLEMFEVVITVPPAKKVVVEDPLANYYPYYNESIKFHFYDYPSCFIGFPFD